MNAAQLNKLSQHVDYLSYDDGTEQLTRSDTETVEKPGGV